MEKLVQININSIILEAKLNIPKDAVGMIIFAHSGGNSRFSPKNNFVASKLQKTKLATLLVGLLTEEENLKPGLQLNIEFIAARLAAIIKWLKIHFKSLQIGIFGASTGASAALIAASEFKSDIKAIVSCGGRADLAGINIRKVKCPTILIIGENDHESILSNKHAYTQLNCTKRLEVIAGASHLFEEPGKLEEAARLSAAWFHKYLNHESNYTIAIT
jgi:putative phosphoribosyl transferase